MTVLRFVVKTATSLVLSAALIAPLATFATTQDETTSVAATTHNNDFSRKVEALIKDGELEEAIELADAGLEKNDTNVKLRFLKAVALNGLNRQEEAALILRELTRAYPEIPEPYNNLASIEAGFGNWEEAKRLLIKALQINPNFALAQKNLGDIYLMLARECYEKASPNLPRNKVLKKRLATLNDLLGY